MALEDAVRDIADRIPDVLERLATEEATKNALVMPFIAALGYDVFNPTEVVPEFTADVGNKSGEKVDYAILLDGQPIILLECKLASTTLDNAHLNQLIRYFSTTPARIGVLTNGIVYRFYADLDRPNMMDTKSFLEFDLTNVDGATLTELQRFTKEGFDAETTLAAASGLKYTREIRQVLGQQLREPDEDFVRFLVNRIYSGAKTQRVIERFKPTVKDAFTQFINNRANDLLRSAISQEIRPEASTVAQTDGSHTVDATDKGITTTVEELEAFHVVKAILREVVPPSRVAIRDFKAHCSVLLDDNIQKRICNFHFNNPVRKSVGIRNAQRDEERIPIDSIDDLYSLADRLHLVVRNYDGAD